MHTNSRESIKKHLTDFFQSSTLTDANLFIMRAADEIHKSKGKYISQTEIQILLSDFIKDVINEKISSSENLTYGSKNFTEIFNANELSILTEKIIDYFVSFPRNYICIFKLPNIVSPRKFSVSFNENISLDFCDQKRRAEGLLNALINNNEYFLTVTVKYSGYLSIVNYDDPYGIFKHIVGIAVAFDYFESNPLRSSIFSKGLFAQLNIGSYFIDEVLGKESKINMHLSDNVNERLHDLEFNKKNADNNYEEIINNIKKIYLSFKNDEAHARRVRSALEWSYDSNFTNNTTFTFILNCIAIEALVGDKGATISKTLGNRCAYMLARTIKDRKYLMEEIEKLYELRSNLVHGNLARPSREDSKIMHFASDLLTRLIKNELLILLDSK